MAFFIPGDVLCSEIVLSNATVATLAFFIFLRLLWWVEQRLPKDVHVLIPGVCYLMWHKDRAGVIKSRILRWGDYHTLSEWVQCNQSQGS